MKRFKNYIRTIENIFFILCLYSLASASATEDKKSEEQYKLQRYEDIKREQQKEYKKGMYNDTEKDYVNDWIGKDINYQKRVIKLKKDYREWVTGKISEKQEVRFNDYEPLKTFTRVEKKILLDYHNLLFKNDGKQKSNTGKRIKKKKRIPIKKPVDEKIITQGESKEEIAPMPGNISTAENTDSRSFGFIIMSMAGILVIAVSSVLFAKKVIKKEK